MEPFGQFIIMGAALLVGAVIAFFAWQADKKRRAELAAWAAQNGWRFSEAKERNPSFPLDICERGHTRYRHMMADRGFDSLTPGLEGASIGLFEHHYAVTTSNGKSTRTTHYYFICAGADLGCDLGSVFIRDETLADKLGAVLGFDDIDLEDPDFSKRFVVKARDRKDAYDLLDHALMAYLRTSPGWTIQTSGTSLWACARGRASVESYARLAAFIQGFAAQLPRTMVNAERSRRGLPPLIEAGNVAGASRERLKAGLAPDVEPRGGLGQ